MVEGEEEKKIVNSVEKKRLPRIPPPRRRKTSDSGKKEKMNKEESVNGREENLNIVCVEKEPPGNKTAGSCGPKFKFICVCLVSFFC